MPRRLVLVALGLFTPAAPAAELPAAKVEFFERKIRPVLVEHCYQCHSEQFQKTKGGLKLDTRANTLAGGDTGPAVVPGKPDASPLVKAVRYHDDLKMPPAGRLPEAVAKDFEAWVRDGAADPREATQAAPAAKLASSIDYAKGRQFWAFQPPKRPPVPGVRSQESGVSNPIDAFVLARLEDAGLPAAGPADPRTLVRRLAFDLTGLPPTPGQVEAFAKDPSPAAYAKLADTFLASPAYGERWARVWLDVARYAEDQAHIVGSDASLTYPNAYLYRNWVIQALNADVPYDRFVKLQLAADLIEGADSPNLAALGFLGLGPKYYSRGTLAVMADEWEDRVDVVTRGLLGLTVACARCHDHKFDPVKTEDYYALAGVFSGTEMFNRPLTDKAEKSPNGQAKKPADAMHVVKEGKVGDVPVFVRGDVNNKGPVAPRRFLPVLCAADPKPFGVGSGRKELADAVAAKANPLTARVVVNRVWASYFGRGLVGTPSNFGQSGDRPTHPELLDWLACELMEPANPSPRHDPAPLSPSGRGAGGEGAAPTRAGSDTRVGGLPLTPNPSPRRGEGDKTPSPEGDGGLGSWSLKRLHRLIVTSATYRQSSLGDPKAVAADPENRLLARMPRRRLSVEQWRDAVLAGAGTLDAAETGGRSIDPLDPKQTRRTVYSYVSRLELNKLLAMFDFPDANVTADRRVETITPLQKMFVLNSPFMVTRAEEFAKRLHADVPGAGPSADGKRIDRAYRLLYGRPPTTEETHLGLTYLAKGDRWKAYAHALLAANELLYLD